MKDAKNKGQSGAQPPAPEWGSLGAWEGGAASILRGPSGLTAPRAPHPAFTILLVIGFWMLQIFFFYRHGNRDLRTARCRRPALAVQGVLHCVCPRQGHGNSCTDHRLSQVQGEIFVKFNDTDDKCRKIVSVGQQRRFNSSLRGGGSFFLGRWSQHNGSVCSFQDFWLALWAPGGGAELSSRLCSLKRTCGAAGEWKRRVAEDSLASRATEPRALQ